MIKNKKASLLTGFLLVCFSLTFSQTWEERKWKSAQSGLKYFVEKKGKKFSDSDTLVIDFVWFSKENKALFTTKADSIGSQKVVLNNTYFVKGFVEALRILGKGGVGYFIIPPDLAVGDEGIQGETTLKYYIEIKK